MADAPVRIRKEVDLILDLQAETAKLEKRITDTRSEIAASLGKPATLNFFPEIQATHARTTRQVEALYNSLNTQTVSQLASLPIEFVRTLFAARDLKANIRQRAIGTFWEMERLDRASAGRDVALGESCTARHLDSSLLIVLSTGTHAYQNTRKKLSRRSGALTRSITQFNTYRNTLQALRPEGTDIHIPDPLPTDVKALREHPELLQDVWVTPSVDVQAPKWLANPNVRKAITANHREARSLEEIRRCGMEADNMCRWFGDELLNIEVAIRLPQSKRSTICLLALAE